MKEQIETILTKFEQSPFSDTQKTAKEITNHVFEFIEWCIINTYKVYDGDWYGVCDEDKTFATIEELYDFWFNNIYNK